MSPREAPATQGEEIIAPIRVRTAPAKRAAESRRFSQRIGAIGTLLMIAAAVTAGGVWVIGNLERHPVQPPAAGPPATETPAPSEPPPLPAPPSSAATPPPAAAAPAVDADTETADGVSRLLASASRQAAAGELSAARSEFEAALRLDPQSAAARDGLQRVKSQMAAEEFRRLMAEGHTALDAGDFARARTRFAAAKGLRPEDPDVAEALAQTENRQRTLRIEALRANALDGEAREDWSAALAAYEEALTLEPNLQFALQGKARASILAALGQRVAFFVHQPQTLQSDAQLENAERLLSEIRSSPQPGPRLRAEADRLAALVQAAKTPVRVRIESDGLTEVSVFRVGRLGRFGARELNLRPGTYTVVGARDGYRDERIELTVPPGTEEVQVTIRCKEKV
jgi:hypothetical protein